MQQISLISTKQNKNWLVEILNCWNKESFPKDYKNFVIHNEDFPEIPGADAQFIPNPDRILLYNHFFDYGWEKERNIILHELCHIKILKIPFYFQFDKIFDGPLFKLETFSLTEFHLASSIFQSNIGFVKIANQPLEYAAEKWMRDNFESEFMSRVNHYKNESVASLPKLRQNIQDNAKSKEYIFEIVARIMLINFFLRLSNTTNIDLENLINGYSDCIKKIINSHNLGNKFLDDINNLVDSSMGNDLANFIEYYKYFVRQLYHDLFNLDVKIS